jgi:hypothetical protein
MRAVRPPSIIVREVNNAREAETLLPPALLARLGSGPAITNARQRELYRSPIVVALDGESPVGLPPTDGVPGRSRWPTSFGSIHRRDAGQCGRLKPWRWRWRKGPKRRHVRDWSS